MKKLVSLLALAGLVMAGPASAQQFFDFLGQANVPASVGGDLELHSIVVNNNQVDTPLPLDFANYQYTLVVTGLTLDTDGFTQAYSGGSIALYEDDGTAADYTSKPTFSDGTALLTGTVVSLNRTMFTGTLGSLSGLVDWTGGSRIGDIAPADRLSWAFLSGISASSSVTQPGYDEQWDGKVEPQQPIVGTELKSWGSVKAAGR